MALRVALLATLGVASLAYLALRGRAASELTREIDLGSLERHLDNWLPKLPFVPFIRIGTPQAGLLSITGDHQTVRIHLLQLGEPGFADSFRRTCADLALHVHQARVSDGTTDLYCEMQPNTATVAPALTALLRNVFAVYAGSRLVASFPGAAE